MTRLGLMALLLPLIAGQDTYPKLAPFSGLKWNGDEPVVQVEGTWYALDAISGAPAKDIVEFCKKTWPDRWKKRFGEDLVEAMTRMGKAPPGRVDLKVKDLKTGAEKVLPGIAMTNENREAVRSGKPASGLTRDQAREDLRQLKTFLEERFSYLSTKGFAWEKALLDIEVRLPEKISRDTLALEIVRFLGRFGDGHTGLDEAEPIPPGFTGFLIGDAGGRLVAFKEDRSDHWMADFPYLSSIDGKPVEEWLKAAAVYVPAGSPTFVRNGSIRMLRNIAFLRSELRLPAKPTLSVELQSEDRKTRNLEIPLVGSRPKYGDWPIANHRELEGGIGYLRIAEMTGESEKVAELVDAFEKFKDTKGLVIDVRGNGGGTRHILRALFPYFMKPADGLHIANVGAYRLPPDATPDQDEGYLQDRELHPVTSSAWSSEDRASIEKFARAFKPEWTPPVGRFSAWHYFGLKAESRPFVYEKPVVVLMDSNCFSATDIFLGAFKGWRNVTLMGTTSGGGSGRARPLVLKESRIQLKVSSIASFRRDGSLYDGRGVAPDVEIHPKPQDFLKGLPDSVLEAALKRLKKK